jgi:ribulose-5-phosphate 4-epimerase/fuculose-1-phosphate aldolase
MNIETARPNLDYRTEREEMAAAFRWCARLKMNEAVANHFSLDVGKGRILINPNQRHFELIRASDLLLLDVNDPAVMDRPDAPDPTAWGLHASVHRMCPHATCLMHVHSIFATVLASLADSRLPAIDQNTAIFHNRLVVDEGYGGMAFEVEGMRCAGLLTDPKVNVMVMGNHGVLILGRTVAETWNRLYYFERAAETYIRALQTGRPLRYLSDAVAEQVAVETETYPGQAERHMADMQEILDREGSDFRG